VNIQLTLNRRQLDVLLSHLESTLTNALPPEQQVRGPQMAEVARQCCPQDWSYDIAQIAPVYLQLVRHWTKTGTPAALVVGPDDQREWGTKQTAARMARLVIAEVDHA
jgi:hypothetical protein